MVYVARLFAKNSPMIKSRFRYMLSDSVKKSSNFRRNQTAKIEQGKISDAWRRFMTSFILPSICFLWGGIFGFFVGYAIRSYVSYCRHNHFDYRVSGRSRAGLDSGGATALSGRIGEERVIHRA